jgi:hypothetical protein
MMMERGGREEGQMPLEENIENRRTSPQAGGSGRGKSEQTSNFDDFGRRFGKVGGHCDTVE